MTATAIQWAQEVWNAIVGCTRVSQGCMNCYAEVMAWRHVLMCRARGIRCKYEGTVELVGGKPRWTGVLNFDEASLNLPLRTRTPKTWFVDSMSDLFHDKVLDQWLDRMFGVMAQCPQHRFLILTKRPDRMRAYSTTMESLPPYSRALRIVDSMYQGHPAEYLVHDAEPRVGDFPWPLPNVWLGVSVEDQATADERIPLLLQTPAALRFLSVEPLLGPVDLSGWLGVLVPNGEGGHVVFADDRSGTFPKTIDWVIVGGESGPGARPCDVAWIRSVIAQCKAAGVPCFVKQLGSEARGWCTWAAHYSNPPHWLDDDGVLPEVSGTPAVDLCHAQEDYFWPCSPKLRDRKGGEITEWPEDLRVREFPA